MSANIKNQLIDPKQKQMFIETFLEIFWAHLNIRNYSKLVAKAFFFLIDKVDSGRENFFTKTVDRESKRYCIIFTICNIT